MQIEIYIIWLFNDGRKKHFIQYDERQHLSLYSRTTTSVMRFKVTVNVFGIGNDNGSFTICPEEFLYQFFFSFYVSVIDRRRYRI